MCYLISRNYLSMLCATAPRHRELLCHMVWLQSANEKWRGMHLHLNCRPAAAEQQQNSLANET